jgi:nicotinamidase-related amidase
MTARPTITVAAERTALVVVDMQNDFCHPDGYYARAGRDIAALAASVAPVRALLDRCRRAGATVAFTRLIHDKRRGAMEERHAIRPLRWTASGTRLLSGSWGADVVDELRPLDGEIVIDKAGYSAFDDTRLEAELRSRGVTTLILAGVVTYACVLATGFSAFDRGFDVLLATEAVGSWNAALGANTSEIVDSLLGRAMTSDLIAIAPGPQR